MSNRKQIIKDAVAWFLFVGLAFFSIGMAGVEEQDNGLQVPEEKIAADNDSQHKKSPAFPFRVGEKLVYEISWYGVTAGKSELIIQEKALYRSREVYRLVFRTTSAGIVGKFYKVSDRLESFIDVQGLFPYYALLRQRQSRHDKDKDVYFDQENHQVSYVTNGGRPRVLPTPPEVLDILSCLYYFRIQDLKVGVSIPLNVFSLKRNYSVEVKVLRKERMKVFSTERDVYLIKPYITFTDAPSREGYGQVWLTADEKKLPVKIRTQIRLGHIDAVLIDYEE